MAENKALEHATKAEANERAERIRKGLPGWRATMADIIAAYQERDWAVLGYDSWEVYVADQFGSLPQFQSTDERNQVIMKLSAEGMTQREMSAATGASQPTVSRTLANGEAGAARDSSESPDPEADETQDGADDEESIGKALIAANARPRAAGKQSPRQAAATKREAGKRTTRQKKPATKPVNEEAGEEEAPCGPIESGDPVPHWLEVGTNYISLAIESTYLTSVQCAELSELVLTWQEQLQQRHTSLDRVVDD